MKVTACMLISQPDFKVVQEAIESLLKYALPNEILFGISPQVSSGKYGYDHADIARVSRAALRGRPGVEIKILGGTDQRKDLARARFGLFDKASGDWIVNLDDDDLALGPLPLDSVAADVGFVHTDIQAQFMVDQSDGSHKAGDEIVRTSQMIQDRSKANLFRGSYYAYRRSAWETVSPYLDRSFPEHEEWRVVWHMLRNGIKGFHVPEVFQLQRVQDAPKRIAEVRSRGISWTNSLKELERIFDDRWWQRWEQAPAREAVEDFWKNDPNQQERRKLYYDILHDVAPESGSSTVLDFGCGTGEDYPELSKVLKLSYKGVDVTRDMLLRARERFPAIDVELDDIFKSKQKTRSHPFVNCAAVLPHLPLDKIPTAISELWRITGTVLIVRVFGVDLLPEDKTLIQSGFIYQRLREKSWTKLFEAVKPARMVVHRGQTKVTRDLMAVELWR